MKKKYEQVIIEVIELNEVDVLTASKVFGGTLPGDEVVDL